MGSTIGRDRGINYANIARDLGGHPAGRVRSERV